MVLFGGACMVLFGGHVWFYLGGVHGFNWGGMRGFFSFFGYNEILLFREKALRKFGYNISFIV